MAGDFKCIKCEVNTVENEGEICAVCSGDFKSFGIDRIYGRITGCHRCREILDSGSNIRCPKCGWLKCNKCGSCRCNYPTSFKMVF